ncbi:MAG: helix-turn-helix domain-containing protein, partial [Enterobacteriaceae bacterium]
HMEALPVCLHKKQHFRELIQRALLFSQSYPEALLKAEIRKSLRHDILDALAELMQDSLQQQQPARGESKSRLLARKAREFVLANPYENITVADLVDHLKVSRRTLQNSFLKVFDITPLNYLRAIRLNAVRRELQSETSCYHTVQDAAMAWGFWHLSQFAADYRLFFAEKPSDTLATRGRLQKIWQRQTAVTQC